MTKCFFENEKFNGLSYERYYVLPGVFRIFPRTFTCTYHNDQKITYEMVQDKWDNEEKV